tara:strand:- start:280 stop:1293 length:1014 start_codon:yes stop_codon:yes gene_type:complete
VLKKSDVTVIRILFIFVILLTITAFHSDVHAEESITSAGEQKTYEFTQYFNRKFKSTLDQQRAFEVSGASASSTLGPTNLGGGKAQFDSNYWGFIDELKDSRGTQSINTTSAPTCDGIAITSPSGEKGYLPPGIDGKNAAALGRSFRCNGGAWTETLDDGTSGSTGLKTSACSAQTLVAGSCKFNFPAMSHLETSFSGYGQLFGNNVNVEGKAEAQCVNGVLNLSSSTCSPVACDPNEIVSWVGSNFNVEHEEYPKCSGRLNEVGFATANATPQFFSDIETAREKTKRTSGLARFACTTNGWKLSQVVPSTCTYIPSSDLTCGKPGFAGSRNIFTCN